MSVSLLRCVGVVGAVASASLAFAQDSPLRPTAVVDLSFDEPDGLAEDRAKSGAAKDGGQPVNAPARVASPFWNVRGGQAVRFDASKTQFVQVPDSADLDHAAGTTLSFYLLNLHDPADAVFRGIVAKRKPNDQGSQTNYGLNFQPSSGRLQVYINDGSGFKVVGYAVGDSFGHRKLAHLTATFRPGDAPEPDADGDADDLEIRLFANGKPVKPADSAGGPVTADAGWVTDVKFAGLPNDTPLTIGASFPSGEPVSAIVDEFLLFDRPLTSEEVSKLFIEVAGPDAERLAKLESEAAPTVTPVVTEATPRGLQVGATTRLTIAGQNLGPEAKLSLDGPPVTVTMLPESTPQRLVADVAVPADVTPTVVSFAVRTPIGISPPLPVSIDRLVPRSMSDATAGTTELPGAFTGTLKGADRPRLLFDGKKDEAFVAEVELKRLGGGADPVLELKTASGTPVDMAWGRSERGGDARLVATLPEDGRYAIELHDLAYQAPASPFRLLAGDLKLIDAVMPAAASASRTGVAVGIGLDGQPVDLVGASGQATAMIAGSAAAMSHDALPLVPLSDGRELTESEASVEPIDLVGGGLVPTYVTGRLEADDKFDRFTLRVGPGKGIDVRVDAAITGSAVSPIVTVVEQGKTIAGKAARPGSSSVSLRVKPETASGTVEVQVADRLRHPGPGQLYRLRVAPVGTPSCDVTGLDAAVTLPASGRGVTRLKIERSGSAGELRLIPDEGSGVVVEPSVFPPGAATEEVFVTLAAAPGRTVGEWFAMSAEVVTPNGTVRRPVKFSPGAAVERFDPNRPCFRVPIVTSSSAPSIDFGGPPAVAFKGVDELLALKVGGEVPGGYAVRLSLVSDEASRPNDPKDATKGTKPAVRLAEEASVPEGTAEVSVPLVVPIDVAAAEVRGVVKAEVVPHVYSDRVAAVGYSAPFRVAVKDAIAAVEPGGPAAVKAGENRQVKAVIRRQEGFAKPVRVELRGLPAGFAAAQIDLPADQSEVTFTVSAPAGTAAGALPEVELAVTGAGGTLLKSVKPFAIQVLP